MMKYIWSPWRMKYISKSKSPTDCIFCKALKQVDNFENLVIYRGELAFVMLNRYPYNNGHLMVVPITHQPSLNDLDYEVRCEIMELLNHAELVLRAVYHPDGLNIGANVGTAAGAGMADHVHFHIVPRWSGDTNFMSTLAGTRVLPEALDETYHRLLEKWESLSK